jgi:hypothetical protein
MRIAPLVISVLLCLNGSITAIAAPDSHVCNVTLGVIDPDAAGTNVRQTPGGKVIGTLRISDNATDDWIEVHVVGQSGEWFLIDYANQEGDGQKRIFTGKGYMHRSVLGGSGLFGTAKIYADHSEKSKQILKSEEPDQQVQALDCWGKFVRIRAKGGIGWTTDVCTNQRTTCV